MSKPLPPDAVCINCGAPATTAKSTVPLCGGCAGQVGGSRGVKVTGPRPKPPKLHVVR